MLKLSKGPSSITIANGDGLLRVVRTDKAITFHQSLATKDISNGLKVQQEISRLVNNMNSKTNFTKRFSKVVTAITEMKAETLFGLAIKLGKFPNMD